MYRSDPPLVERNYYGKPTKPDGFSVSNKKEHGILIALLIVLGHFAWPLFSRLFILPMFWICVTVAVGPALWAENHIHSPALTVVLLLIGLYFGVRLFWWYIKCLFLKLDKHTKINHKNGYQGLIKKH